MCQSVALFKDEAHATEFSKLGRIPCTLGAHQNADLHMSDDLKNTGKGNRLVIFGEPDITPTSETRDNKVSVKVNGVMFSIPTPEKSAATGRKALPAGSIF